MFGPKPGKAGMCFNARADIDKIKPLAPQKLMRVIIDRRYAKGMGQRLSLCAGTIIDRNTLYRASLQPAGEL